MKTNLLPVWLAACALLPVTAHAQNIEDEPLEDAPVPVAPQPVAPAPAAPVAPPVAVTPPVAAPPVVASGETVTIPRNVWEQLMRDVEELKRTRGATNGSATSGTIGGEPSTNRVLSPGEAEDPSTGTGTSGGSGGARNFLLLPDISLITTAKGNFSSDKRDADRRRFSLAESELNIQGYVYPGVKAVANIVSAPGEGEPFGMEEGYLNFQGARKNLNVILGRKFAPFGRTGEQHPHSWLYSRQLIPRANLVAGEALVGDGILARYLLPTGGKLYANLDLGVWNSPEDPGAFDSTSPFGSGIETGTASGFNDRFYTARLLLGKSFGADTEFELGASYARGKSQIDDVGAGTSFNGRNVLSGADISFRRYFANNRRLLMRAEYFRNTPKGGLLGAASKASGYYSLANLKLDKQNDIGLLFERSGFPQAPGQRETALSLIYTRQLTEQFYFRLHGTRGHRPGGGDYSQIIGQVTFGIGPHTHELE